MDIVPDNTSVPEAWRRQVLRRLRELYLIAGLWALLMLLIGALALLQPFCTVPAWILCPALLLPVVLMMALVFIYRNPRCPACHKTARNFMMLRYCPSCGVRLMPPPGGPDPVVQTAWQKRMRWQNVRLCLDVVVLALSIPFLAYMKNNALPSSQYGYYSLLAGLPPLAAIGLIYIVLPVPRCPVCSRVNPHGSLCLHCGTQLSPEPVKIAAADVAETPVQAECEDSSRRQRKVRSFFRCPACNGRVHLDLMLDQYCQTCGTQLKDAPAANRKAS